MKIETLKKYYQGKSIEDSGSYMSESSKLFARRILKCLKEIANNNNAELEASSTGHYYISGFVKKDDKYVYFSRDIERYNKLVNLDDSSCMNGFLIRSAKSNKTIRVDIISSVILEILNQ